MGKYNIETISMIGQHKDITIQLTSLAKQHQTY